MTFALDYTKMILLDAEDLAEGGIKNAYESMLSALSQHVAEPAEVWERLDDDGSRYVAGCGQQEYTIYSNDLPNSQGESWGRATHAFFRIVNDQLAKSEYSFYAITGGNDLGGMFLTESECTRARESLKNKRDWPYLPTLESPWYGQYSS